MDRRNFLNTFGKSAIIVGSGSANAIVDAFAKEATLRPQGNPAPKQGGMTAKYDRAYLETLGERYLEALVAHDPARVPFSDKVIFGENNQRLQPGEACWRTIDGLGRYRHFFADPENGLLGLIANVYENGTGCILVLRLKVDNNLIVEAEQWVSRDPNGAALYEKLGKPDPVWLEPIPLDQMQSREALEAVSYMYFQSLERNDGAGVYPFREDCERIEHARPTVRQPKVSGYGHADTAVDFVTLPAKEQYELGMMAFVTRIVDRRTAVVDVERGAVLGQSCYEFDGLLKTIHFDSGVDWEIPPYFRTPRTHQANEAFKIINGSFRYIEMTFIEVPFSTRQVVPGKRMTVKLDYVPSAPAHRPLRATGRAELTSLAGQVVEGLIECCPHQLPLAERFRYTENGLPVRPEEGTWKTATGRRSYGITLADPSTGQAGWFGALDEHGLFAMMALRLKVDNGLITEIETIIARPELPPAGSTLARATQTMFMPPLVVDLNPNGFDKPAAPLTKRTTGTRNDLAAAVESYFAAFTGKKGSLARLAPGCMRRENGILACNNPEGPVVDKEKPTFRLFERDCAGELDRGFLASLLQLRSRRSLLVDESQGLALDLALLDNPATTKSVAVAGIGELAVPRSFRSPWTDLHAQLFKVEAGKIAHIEGIVRRVPYGQKSGWEA